MTDKFFLLIDDYEIELNMPANITELSDKRKIILENEYIRVSTTGRDYDFIATVENLTNYDIEIHFENAEHIDDEEQDFNLNAKDWFGLMASVDGYIRLSAFYNGNFYVTVKK